MSSIRPGQKQEHINHLCKKFPLIAVDSIKNLLNSNLVITKSKNVFVGQRSMSIEEINHTQIHFAYCSIYVSEAKST